MEFSRTSLASRTSSRTHFEVLGLGLEGQVLGLGLEGLKSSKIALSSARGTAVFFELLKFCGALEKFLENIFRGDRLKNFCEDLFFLRSPEKFLWRPFFFFGEHLRLCPWSGLGPLGSFEHSCPWPRECLSSERLSLALASDFFCVIGLGLGLEPCVLDSTSGY